MSQQQPKSSRPFYIGASVALAIAAALLFRADALKHAEVVAYQSATPRIAMVGVAAGVGLMAWIVLLGAGLSDFFTRRGWEYTRKGAAANAFGVLILALGVAPALLIVAQVTLRWDGLEASALESRAVVNGFAVIKTERTRSRHYFWTRCTVTVADSTGRRHILQPLVPEERLLEPGDSVYLRYLPANPTVYKLLASVRQGEDMVVEADLIRP